MICKDSSRKRVISCDGTGLPSTQSGEMRLVHAKHAHHTIPNGTMRVIHSRGVMVVVRAVAAVVVVVTTMTTIIVCRVVRAAPVVGIVGTGITRVIRGITISAVWHILYRLSVASRGIASGGVHEERHVCSVERVV